MFRKTTVSILLASFIALALFSFALMANHGMNDGMGGIESNCPFSFPGSDCPENSVAMAIHHSAAYQSFASVVLTASAAMFFALVLLALVLTQMFVGTLPAPQTFAYIRPPPRVASGRKLIRWYSLLENSPSVV